MTSNPCFTLLRWAMRLTTLLVLVLGLSLGALPVAAAPAAMLNEICTADQITASCPPNPVPMQTIFWAPANCGTLGKTNSRNMAPRAFISIFNANPSRTLTVWGTSANDVMVGSPGTPDTLRGQGGRNAYVVGGGTATLGADRAFVDPLEPPQSRPDIVEMNVFPNGIHYINISKNGQINPGTIKAPSLRVTPAVPVDVVARGSNDLPTKPSCALPASTTPLANPYVLASYEDPLLTQQPKTPKQPDTSKAGPSFANPGAPILKGFRFNADDRIILKSSEFPIQAWGNQEWTSGNPVIPIQLIDEPLKAQAAAPLVYSNRTGLLLLAQNREPLGSEANPGLLIAQLLDQRGRPLRLKPTPGNPFLLSRSVIVTPPDTQADPNRPKDPTTRFLG